MNIYSSSDSLILAVTVDDNSYRNRQIMGDHNLTLFYSLAEHTEIPVGSYVEYQGVRYTLERPEAFKMKHRRLFEYTVTFEAYQSRAKRWKFRNTVDGRLKFPLTATPREHLQMFVDNMNRRDSGWTIGACVTGVEHLINYDNNYCLDALQAMASEFGTEFEISGKTVSLHKVEYNKSNPLPLSYGRGNGFKPNVGRSNSGDAMPVEILFAVGGEDNIDTHAYGNRSLLLPEEGAIGFDGVHFSDEQGFDATNARYYAVSEDRLSIQRSDRELSSQAEDSLDCSDIYPKRIGTVGQVIIVDADNHFYDFTDTNPASDPCPDFEEYLIAGETMTVRFQSGMLAGREFEVNYNHNPKTEKGVQKLGRRFEIVPQEIDGVTMPDATFKPAAGDTYAVFHCSMPTEYTAKAEADMFRAAVRYMYEHEDQRFSFTGELDGIWAKKDWVNIGGRIVLGGYIRFTDESFQTDPVLVRITGIKDYINNPHSPEITLSNETITGGFSSEFKRVQAEEITVDENFRRGEQFTKRRFRDAQETMKMLEASLIEGFTGSISPVAAQMLQLLVGDESLQFRFVTSHTAANPAVVTPVFAFDGDTGIFSVTGGYYLQHLTLGINTMKASHDVNEYKWWSVQSFTSAVLDDPNKKYYLYLKCPTEVGTACVFRLSDKAIKIDGESGYYHLLVGVLNSEYEGKRSFAPLYGFTEVTGGRITTDKIVSNDGTSFLDLVHNVLKLGDKLKYNVNGDGGLVLSGSFVQSGNGTPTVIGAWCGAYDLNRLYGLGDEVYYTHDGLTSSYRYINSVATKGNLPTDENYWEVFAKGVKGQDGQDGLDGADGKDGVDGKNAYSPYVGTNGNWFIYDDSQGKYVDSGRTSKGDEGHSPYILNGYWWEWDASQGKYTNTGIKAKGEDGTNGSDGKDGVDGKNAYSPYVGTNGNWFIYDDSQGKYVDSGRTSKGDEGHSPYILNGYWWEWDASQGKYTNTGIKAKGEDGTNGSDGKDGVDGRGIVSTTIEYNSSSSGTTAPVSGWSTTIPTVVAGFYLWTRTTVNYTSGSDSVSYTSARQGSDGKDGKDGAEGKRGAAIVFRGEYNKNSKTGATQVNTYFGTDNRLDVVYYPTTNRYYIAKSGAGEFSDKIPTNTAYWNDFGASFDSVATGFLFAEEAVLDNAVVRFLRTAENGKRILIQDNEMAMYDGQGRQKLLVTADDIDTGSPSSTYPTNNVSVGGTYSQNGRQGQDQGSCVLCTFVVPSNNTTVKIPSLQLSANCQSGYYGGSIDNCYSVITIKNGSDVVSTLYSQQHGSYSDITTQAKDISLSAGTYTIELYATWEWWVDDEGSYGNWISFTISNQTKGNVVVVSQSAQTIQIGANGIAIHLGNSFSAVFALKNNSPMILLQGLTSAGAPVGLQINTTDGVTINRGSGWVKL